MDRGSKVTAKPAAAAGSRLSDDERIDWLRLARSENVGPATFRSLIAQFRTAQAALEALPRLAQCGGAGRRIAVAARSVAEKEIAAAARIGVRFVALPETDYPTLLRHADAPPPLLAVSGASEPLLRRSVAIVGARNASAAGRKMAEILARDLGEAGLAIVSGLARGIDASAHQASLATGTVAVFAGGLDRVYPPENAGLAREIVARDGALVSEMPLGWEPRARDFPRRNRIIAGLTVATIVIEAAERSGSLITARLALEQNREVLAVPGSPLDPRAAGSNGLLKRGARLVTEAADVLDAIAATAGDLPLGPARRPELPFYEDVPPEPGDADRDRLAEALGPTPVEVDEIIRMTGLPTRNVQVMLLEMELAGRLERHPGQRVSLI